MITLKRLTVILVAYALASIATGVVVAALHFILPTYTQNMQSGLMMEFMSLAWGFSLMVAAFASAFALWVVTAAEWLKIRGVVYFAIAGACIGLVLGTMLREQSWFPYAGFGQGLVAGAIYWSVAGKSSGPAEPKGALLIILPVLGVLATAVIVPLFVGLPRAFTPF